MRQENAILSFGKTIPEDAIRLRLDKQQWKSFLESIRPFASSWKKEYWAKMCDGIQWEVKDDFDDFLKAIPATEAHDPRAIQ